MTMTNNPDTNQYDESAMPEENSNSHLAQIREERNQRAEASGAARGKRPIGGTMKTFTLNEMHTNYGLLRSVNIVELPSGAFVLEGRQWMTLATFATTEEAEAALQTESRLCGLEDAQVVRIPAEAAFEETGHLVWKDDEGKFAVGGYLVSRLEGEFATKDEADTVVTNAAESCVEALHQEMTNASKLPVIEVIKVKDGQVTVRQGPNIGRWYTFTDTNGEECSTNNLSMWMHFGMPKLSAPQTN